MGIKRESRSPLGNGSLQHFVVQGHFMTPNRLIEGIFTEHVHNK